MIICISGQTVQRIVLHLILIFVFNFNPLHGNGNETSLWVENLGNSALSILGNPNITNDKKEIFLKVVKSVKFER